MKNQKTLISVLVFIVISTPIYSQKADSNSSDLIDLETILKKCAEYCERLANSSLFFICNEKIKEEIYHYGPKVFTLDRTAAYLSTRPQEIEKNVYVYDYQLIRKDNEIKEQRILIEENGKKKQEKDAPLKTRIFKHKNIIMGPIGLLSEYWQRFHDYEIIKEDKLKGDKAIVIEAIPKSGQNLNHLFGKIWVRKSDFSILRIDWNQTSIENYEILEDVAKKEKIKPRIILIAEYAFEKNGIRFPSRYAIEESYISPARRFIASKNTVIYEEYKFFTVETETKY